MKTLSKLLTHPSELIDVMVYLCDAANQHEVKLRTRPEVRILYSAALTTYNDIVSQKHADYRLLDPIKTVDDYLNFITIGYSRREGRLRRNPAYSGIEIETIQRNYSTLIYFLFIKRFNTILRAIEDSLRDPHSEYTLLLESIHYTVEKVSPQLSSFTANQFISAVDILWDHHVRPNYYDEEYLID